MQEEMGIIYIFCSVEKLPGKGTAGILGSMFDIDDKAK